MLFGFEEGDKRCRLLRRAHITNNDGGEEHSLYFFLTHRGREKKKQGNTREEAGLVSVLFPRPHSSWMCSAK